MNLKQLSREKFQDNKYSRWYFSIIEKAQARPRIKGGERHHILPKGKFMFPQFSNLKEHPWNAVMLTLREHFVCHLLLTKMTEGEAKRSSIYGLMRFSSGKQKCNSRQYALAKALFKRARKGCPNPAKGKPGRKWTEEEKTAHSLRMKEVMNSSTTKAKCSAAKVGRPGHIPTEKHRAAISKAQRNLTQEQRERKRQAKLGAKNGVFGKIWVTDGKQRKLVNPGEVPPGFYQRSAIRNNVN